MAAGDITIYNNLGKALADGDIDFAGDTIKGALVTGHTLAATDDFFSDVSADESSGTGYTAGGATLASVTVTEAAGTTTVDAADVTFSSLDAGTPSHFIIYKDTGSAATSPLAAAIELGTASNGADYTVAFNAAGIFTIS